MEIQELECYKLSKNFSPLSLEACSNNNFAVVIRTGVHILSVVPNLNSNEEVLNVQRSLIKTPTDYPLADLTIDMQSLNREKFCLLNLNSKYLPVMEKTLPAAAYVKQINFVDSYCSVPVKSTIGILTNHGCLQFFSKCRYNWIKLIDISVLWKKYCLTTWFSTLINNDFENYKKKSKYIRIIAFVSCEEFFSNEDKSWLIACISENGIISFWKIDQILQDTIPTLINTFELKVVVNTLHWHRINDKIGWIIAACLDGTVKIYSCEKTNDQITITLLRDIWKDPDQILPLNVKIKTQCDRVLIAFSKENFVLAFSLLNDDIITFTQEFEKKVIGLEITDESTIFVILTNTEVFNLKIEDQELRVIPVSFKTNTSIKNHSCWGISFSKNNIFCAISMNINRYFDHLIIKEPWYILLCHTRKEVTYTELQKLTNNISLYDAFDYVEYFRLCCIRNKRYIHEDILKNLWNSLNDDIDICRKNFQIMYILSQCCRISQNTLDLFVIETLCIICNFLYYIDKLADIKKQYYFYQWLSSNLPKLPTFLLEYKQLKNISELLITVMDYNAEEKCEICSCDISDHSNLKFVMCEKGHRVLRCSFSFLPLGIQPYIECSICHSIFLQSEDFQRCLICDNKLVDFFS